MITHPLNGTPMGDMLDLCMIFIISAYLLSIITREYSWVDRLWRRADPGAPCPGRAIGRERPRGPSATPARTHGCLPQPPREPRQRLSGGTGGAVDARVLVPITRLPEESSPCSTG